MVGGRKHLPIMTLKRRMGMGLAVAAATYCVLAYIFMWPPVVLYYWNWHEHDSRGELFFSPPWPHAHAVSGENACLNNLRQIDAAIIQFSLERAKHEGDLVTVDDITPYIKLNNQGQIPPCPAGGPYNITVVGKHPTCSLDTNPPARIRVDYFFWDWNQSSRQRLPY